MYLRSIATIDFILCQHEIRSSYVSIPLMGVQGGIVGHMSSGSSRNDGPLYHASI